MTHVAARAQAASPEELARELRLPRVEFRQANVIEAISFLQKKCEEDGLPPERVLNINYAGQGKPPETLITCSMRDVSLLELLHSVANQANLILGATDQGIYLFRPGELPPEIKGVKELTWTPKPIKMPEAASYSRGRKDALGEAAMILENAFGRRAIAPEAKEALETLRRLSMEESAKEIR
jgi:hypothetical protein